MFDGGGSVDMECPRFCPKDVVFCMRSGDAGLLGLDVASVEGIGLHTNHKQSL
jgi:hypothetical protein